MVSPSPDGEADGVERVTRVGAWDVAMRWPSLANEGPTEIRISPAPGIDPRRLARGITTGVLRAIPLSEVAGEVRGLWRSAQEGKPDAERVRHSLERMARLVREAMQVDPRPGRRGRPDEFYVAVAVIYARYVDLRDPKPVRRVAELCGENWRTVANWVRLARQRGLLTENAGAEADGELTARAAAVLAAMAT
ncbi:MULTISPECIES: hypothetical protein [Actinomadura]|uniref:Uncharacterized protein n=1 Tax=Actinomadura yumaensis TaxID=111807 RepID=A0ABW2D0Q9_9ACTN|nr:hypothetical protein [Actinomadura sp. J1-007]MWK38864.1 hypothetical protein [Actinomadura sp. J1-007]